MNGGHDRFEELAVGHALAALEPDDEQAFLAHLRGCAACERNVAAHTETLSHLAYAAGPVELPDSLLSGIRAGVRASGRPMASPAAALERPATLDEARARRRLHVHPRSLTAAAAVPR